MQKYAVVDIEATGGTQKVDRIIEVGIVLLDGQEIVDKFSTLVNPGISIPPFITKLTGISQSMVADAPAFHEIAKKIVLMTEGRSLVAHNVSFDYRILREEFDRLGYEFKSDTLCTARLAKHYFPEIEKYNLKRVATHLGLPLEDRHRAGDDALATAEVMKKILIKSQQEGLALKNMSIYKRKSRLPFNMTEEQILDLPNVCGVYYMLDENDEPVYIGKSIKIRTRIRSHFSEESSKTMKMQKMVHRIIYTETGSELMAEVFESLEIRKHRPLLNKAKRKSTFDIGVYLSNFNGYQTIRVKHKSKIKDKRKVLQWFSSKNAAKAFLATLVYEHNLCGCLCSMNSQSKDCTTYKINACNGAYLQHEDIGAYNIRVSEAKKRMRRLFQEDMLILHRGREDNEFAAFLITNHVVSHVGYIKDHEQHEPITRIMQKLDKIPNLPEIDRLVYREFYEGRIKKKILVATETAV